MIALECMVCTDPQALLLDLDTLVLHLRLEHGIDVAAQDLALPPHAVQETDAL